MPFSYTFDAITGHVAIDEGSIEIPKLIFDQRTDVKSVFIPDSVIRIGNRAFAQTGLSNITIPNSVLQIGEFAFQGNALTEIIIGDSVTSIGDSAFINNSLLKVVIPESVTSIGSKAFCFNNFANVSLPAHLEKANPESAFDFWVDISFREIIQPVPETEPLPEPETDPELPPKPEPEPLPEPEPKPLPEPEPAPEPENPVSRLYNPSQGRHLFSSNETEINILTGSGWTNEGTIYLAPEEATAQVFRFYVISENRHFYTALESERDLIIGNQDLVNTGWRYEGAAFSAYSSSNFPDDSIAVVRYLNQESGNHVYSTSTYEQGLLNADSKWQNEGIAWYGDALPESNEFV